MLFDIGATELLAIVIIAIVVIGPKELPLAMRTVGRWVSKARNLMGQFRTSLDSIAHEAEMESLEKQWAEQNARIMKEHSDSPAMLPMDGAASHGQGPSTGDEKTGTVEHKNDAARSTEPASLTDDSADKSS